MNLSIRSKIIAFVLPIIPALIIFSALLESTHRKSEALRNDIVQTYEVNNTISALLTATQSAEIGERDYLITHEKDSLDFYLVGVNDVLNHLATLRRLTKANPIQQLRVNELDGLLQKELAALKKAIVSAQISTAVGALNQTIQTLDLEEEIRHVLAAMSNEELSLLALRKSEFTQHRSEQQTIELTLLIGLALLYLILAILLIRSIAKPINALSIKANKMAKGNYSSKMEELGSDELGQLGRAFNKATEAIQIRNQEAKDKQTRLQAVIESSIEGIITINNMGIVESVNPMALKMFGYSKDELIGKNINLLMPEPYHSEHDSYLQHYKQTGVKKIIGIGREVTGLCKDGSVFPMELSVSEMNINGQQMFSGLVRDITERKNFELEIQNREARYRSVITTVIDGIITIDQHGLIESMNPAAEKIFGYPFSEAKGKNLKILMPESYHSEYDQFLLNYISKGEAKTVGIAREVSGKRKNGVIFPMELSISELQVDGKRLFSGLVRDITERKRVDTMKNEFISTVSHELRTPLTSIQGALELMLSGAMGQVPDTCTPLLKIASNNSARLVRLINDILDVEKIESGKMELKLETLDINKVIEESILANKAYGDEHG
ncbi:MAG: PAS domain S-box protein, partial [Cycloclasticus sp.]|nr:PAS domain S-box protein [Cycloclasticus sp.]MBQ0790184.1 PAS domain S-box protein [Cycloclasticus sp.]